MNICVITDKSFLHGIGGKELNSYQLCKELIDRGHSATMLTTELNECSGAGTAQYADGRLRVYGLPRSGDVKCWSRSLGECFGRLQQASPFDIVHVHDLSSIAFLESPYFRNLGIPVVMSCHGIHSEWIRCNLRTLFRVSTAADFAAYTLDMMGDISFLLRYHKKVGRIIDACIAFDPKTAQLASLQYNFLPQQVMTIYNGVDPNQFCPKQRGETYARHYIARNRRIILFAGRLVIEKGPRILMAAMYHIANTWPQAYLLVVGDGPLLGSLVAEAGRGALKNRVAFTGAVSRADLAMYMNDAELIVNPVLHKWSYTTTTLEAMACAKPLIVSEYGGLDAFLRHNYNVIRIRSGNVGDIVRAVDEAFRDQDRMIEIGINARNIVLENFTSEQTTQHTLSLYRALTRSNPNKIITKGTCSSELLQRRASQ